MVYNKFSKKDLEKLLDELSKYKPKKPCLLIDEGDGFINIEQSKLFDKAIKEFILKPENVNYKFVSSDKKD